MFDFFNRNSFLSYAALPLVVVVMRLRIIVSPHVGFSVSDTDLYTPVWTAVFGSLTLGSMLSVAIAIAVALIIAFLANSINNRYHFTPRQNNLCGFFFPILSGGFVVAQGIHPMNIFMILFVLAMYRILTGEEEPSPSGRKFFEAGVLIGLSYLLWAKTLWFVPFLLIMMAMLRLFNGRNILGLIVGILFLPVVFIVHEFLTDADWRAPIETYRALTVVPVAFYKTGWLARSYLIFYSLVLLLAILSSLGRLHRLKIIESRQTRVVMWLVFYTALLIMTPYFSFELQMPLAFGGALLLAIWMQTLRSNFREAVTAILIIFTLVVQWYL